MELAKGFLKSIFEREGGSLSRRDALAVLGLAGVLLAAPKLLALTPAEAKPIDKPADTADSAPVSESKVSDNKVGNADAANQNMTDVTDLSAQRYWRRRYWRRRYWRPWRRHYWRRRYWRRRYW